ncbi:MAG: glutamine-hydrolyzing GMP synthase [Planctomycetia bacterium]|nr:glutamine-hydrolyzing GMP synthase [Planctomycetia bacterium]
MGARPVLVVDFGAQYAQLIARRVREARVYSEIVPHTVSADEVRAKDPSAIILSGGPASVYAPKAPGFDSAIFELGIPMFGICYGFQAMAQGLGGSVARTGGSEYGGTPLTVERSGTLLNGLPDSQNVWMSHGDSVERAPDGFDVLASTPGAPVAAFECAERRMAGVQFHPEVIHTAHGQRMLEHFLWQIAGCEATWTMAGIIDEQVERIREQVGSAQVICGLSGGVS